MSNDYNFSPPKPLSRFQLSKNKKTSFKLRNSETLKASSHANTKTTLKRVESSTRLEYGEKRKNLSIDDNPTVMSEIVL